MKRIEQIHMKHWRKVNQILKEVNVVVEVLDARFPNETKNKLLEKIVRRKGKKLIMVINKIDLIPKKFLYKELSYFKDAIPVSSRERKGKKKLLDKIKQSSLGEIRVGVVGYPNVGKSSLINYLKGKKSTKVSPIPGFTKGIQWIRIGRIMLYDTPGVLPPQTQKRMILLGAVDPSIFEDPIPAAHVIISKIKEVKPNYFKEKTTEEILESIAKKYNFKKKGNQLDIKRAARKLLDDWIKGKIKIYWLK